MTHIESITDCAATLYRHGVKLPDAVASALSQYGIQDRAERETLYTGNLQPPRKARRQKEKDRNNSTEVLPLHPA